jgi:hypothetical protein
MEVGVFGASGPHAPNRVPVEPKPDREAAIIPLPVMEAGTAADIRYKMISATQ